MTAIGAVLVTGVLLASAQVSSRADVLLLNTPAWQGRTLQYGEQLLLRRDGQALLLKHSNRDGAYRYDPRTRRLTLVTQQDWDRPSGPVAECNGQFPPTPQVLRIDQQSHKLIAGTRAIPIAGNTALALTESPDHHFVAVLSTSGRPQRSLLPFLGGGGATGQRYHQVVSLPDVVVTGKTVRIPVERDESILGICWSAEQDAIVYYDILFAHVSVVEVDL